MTKTPACGRLPSSSDVFSEEVTRKDLRREEVARVSHVSRDTGAKDTQCKKSMNRSIRIRLIGRRENPSGHTGKVRKARANPRTTATRTGTSVTKVKVLEKPRAVRKANARLRTQKEILPTWQSQKKTTSRGRRLTGKKTTHGTINGASSGTTRPGPRQVHRGTRERCKYFMFDTRLNQTEVKLYHLDSNLVTVKQYQMDMNLVTVEMYRTNLDLVTVKLFLLDMNLVTVKLFKVQQVHRISAAVSELPRTPLREVRG